MSCSLHVFTKNESRILTKKLRQSDCFYENKLTTTIWFLVNDKKYWILGIRVFSWKHMVIEQLVFCSSNSTTNPGTTSFEFSHTFFLSYKTRLFLSKKDSFKLVLIGQAILWKLKFFTLQQIISLSRRRFLQINKHTRKYS